jgi:DNA gyrase subunit A
MKVTEKTGEVVGAIAVEESDELMLMTTGGQSIRIRVSEVRETGRNAQGVKLVSLRGGEKLQGIAKVLSGDVADEEESGEDEESGEGQEGAEAPSAPGDPESDSDASVDSSGEEE